MVLPVRPEASSSARSPTVCGPALSEARPSLAMTRFSPTSGTTSASVPIAAILMNAGSQLSRAGARAERLHQLERDADAGQVLVGIACSRAASGLITASAGGSVAVRLVMVGDDQVDAERRARRAASAPRMPQSTETISRTPSACSRSIAAGCRP